MDEGTHPAQGPRERVLVLVAADLVILTIRQGSLRALLIERANAPYRGMLALPGGFMRPGEDLRETAERELQEETSLDSHDLHLEQLAVYSAPDRDPRGRVVSTAFLAIAPDLPIPEASTDARSADWLEVTQDLYDQLSFDHADILRDGLERARSRLEYTTIATAFCTVPFTMTELRQVYEAVWGTPLDPRNFGRKVHKTDGFVIDTGEKRTDGGGRPATLYRRGIATALHPAMLRPTHTNHHTGEPVTVNSDAPE